ncbi:MAG: putative zinc-binding metallopeptidase [Leeuwenhoekiella sp.]
MKIFHCNHCSNPVYFENTSCEKCGNELGYLSEISDITVIRKKDNALETVPDTGKLYQYCANHNYKVCNWLVALEDLNEEGLCEACDLNRTIPNLQDPEHLKEWRNLERAKHRLVYTLKRLNLPVVSKNENAETGLAFDFLSSDPKNPENGVKTGHFKGIITINIAEADPVHREYMRSQMAERYRTLLGHFRHEVGHYYWERIVFTNPTALEAFRNCFGNETLDYGEALQKHYQNGPPENWEKSFVSKYAASHPWEDWAETWAHYLHLVDTLETAYSFGLSIDPGFQKSSPLHLNADFDPYLESDFEKILGAYLPLTFAVNSLNRSMGQPDLYPFILPPPVVDKLTFIHRLLKGEFNK